MGRITFEIKQQKRIIFPVSGHEHLNFNLALMPPQVLGQRGAYSVIGRLPDGRRGVHRLLGNIWEEMWI